MPRTRPRVAPVRSTAVSLARASSRSRIVQPSNVNVLQVAPRRGRARRSRIPRTPRPGGGRRRARGSRSCRRGPGRRSRSRQTRRGRRSADGRPGCRGRSRRSGRGSTASTFGEDRPADAGPAQPRAVETATFQPAGEECRRHPPPGRTGRGRRRPSPRSRRRPRAPRPVREPAGDSISPAGPAARTRRLVMAAGYDRRGRLVLATVAPRRFVWATRGATVRR